MRFEFSRPSRPGLCLSVFFLLFIAGPGGTVMGRSTLPPHVPGEVLVKFRAGTSLSAPDAVLALMGGTRLNTFRTGVEHWKAGPGIDTDQALALVRANAQVQYAEPNYIVHIDLTPNDPLYPDLWGLNNTGQTGGVPGADIDAEEAWNILTGSPQVLVGVIDTGIDYTHPDLAANIWTNPGEIPGNGIDDDLNGYVDDIHGYDFVSRDGDPMDDHGHGTHVAGTIGAVGNNGVGVAGVNWTARIGGIKFLDAGGGGTTAAAIEAVDYATMMGFDLTNNSWGGGGFSQALLDSINAAGVAGSLFVASAGNSASNADLFPSYPAAYDAPNIISVAATDHTDSLAWFSNYGPVSVDLGAPGLDILSTFPGGSYTIFSGTSMASPHVSGVSALMMALNPDLSLAALKMALLDSTDPIPALAGLTVSGGRLNAVRALRSLDTIPPDPIADLVLVAPTSNTILLAWTAPGEDGPVGTAVSYDVRYATTPLDETTFSAAPRASDSPVPGPPGTSQTMEVTGLSAETAYYLAVKAIDAAGNAGPISNVVSGTTLPPPTVATSPGDFTFSLFTGQSASAPLTVRNVGVGTLDWSIPTPLVAGAGPGPGGVQPPKGPAVQITALRQWLTAFPSSGRLFAGESLGVDVTADALGLPGGTYNGTVMVQSNDPGSPSVPHPVVLTVADAPAMAVGPLQLDFQTVFLGYSRSLELTVVNVGTLDLAADIASGDPTVTINPSTLLLSPGAQAVVQATFTPTASGAVSTSITITSNAPNAPSVQVAVNAIGAPAPGISVAPASFGESLFTGGSTVRTLSITNTGGSDLDASLSIEAPVPPVTMTAAPSSAIVAPGETRDFTITFAAGASGTALYAGAVRIATNIPGVVVTVPAEISVTAAPDLRVGGEMIVLSSTVPYFGSGSSTSHSLAVAVPPIGGGTIDLVADGDYGFPGETASLRAESRAIGSVGGTSGEDCTPAAGSFALSAELLADLAADGVVNLHVQNSPFVDVFCAANEHRIQLSYEGPSDHIDFGTLFVSQSRSFSIVLANQGAGALEVTSIASSRPEFVPSVARIPALLPGESVFVTVTFTPVSDGLHEATLSIHSDDPDTPLAIVRLSGQALFPPEIDVSPVELSSDLFTGEQETTTLTVFNNGPSPLDFAITATHRPGPGFAAVPFSGLSAGDPAASDNGTASAAQPDAVPVNDESWRGTTGSFDRLASSPQALTCVVEHRAAGVLYAQQNSGNGFFRYHAATDEWESLARSPIFSSNNGGAALLNGKVYTSYTQWDLLGAYDIASDTWTTIQSPQPFTGNIGSDGVQYLYLLVGQSLVRFDPVTGETAELAPAPYYFEPWGGIRHHQGVLFAHQGNGFRGFASYDIATNVWTILPSVPSGAVLGSAIDPVVGSYYAYGTYGGSNLYQYSFTQRAWSVLTIPLFSVNDGGMGWLPFPVPGLYFIQGQAGPGFGRLVLQPDFIRLGATSGVVPPGGTFDVDVTFDAAGLFGGVYAANLAVTSNDPVRPQVTIPATLHVTGQPDIGVSGERVDVTSVVSYGSSGESTSHSLEAAVSPGGPGTVEVIADGDYGDSGEYATVAAEGVSLGRVPGETGADCTVTRGAFPVTQSVLESLVADGVVNVTVQNTPPVDSFCSINSHTVRLVYSGPSDHLSFGQVFAGGVAVRTIVVSNNGTDLLHVGPISSSAPEFTPSIVSFDLAPLTSQSVQIAFLPPVVGEMTGTLSIPSNDPDQPLVSMLLSGSGVEPPVAAVAPTALSSTLLAGESEVQQVVISNSGGSDLEFEIEVRVSPPASRVTSPFRGLSQGEPPASSGKASAPGPIVIGNDESYQGIPGDFELLAPSPVPLTSVAEDRDNGVLYALAISGNSFYRYSAASNTWEALAFIPFSGFHRAGAVLLNGKVYVANAESSIIGVYDIAANAWTQMSNPLPFSGNIAGDGRKYLYLASGSALVRLDPATSLTTTMAAPPFVIDRRAGIRHLSGILYAHQGAGQRGFASYDVTRDEWTSLPMLPAGAVQGAAIDPLGRHFYAYGPWGGRNLYRYSIDDGTWSVATSPFFTVADGGMGWLQFPTPGLCFVQGWNGAGLARLITGAGFIELSATTGIVPPGGSLTVDVAFDSTGLLGGVYGAELIMSTNDPAHAELTVPAVLTVIGRPVIQLQGGTVTLESVVSYATPGATTTHDLQVTPLPGGPGTIDLIVQGDYGDAAETATLAAEGTVFGAAGGTGNDCGTASRQFPLSSDSLAALAADGVIHATVQNALAVDAHCVENRHTVRLRYESTADSLDFGELFVGLERTLTVVVANDGTDVLHVGAITSSSGSFSTPVQPFDLAPGGARAVEVIFRPLGPGAVSGTLSIPSDDPLTPVASLPLNGTGLEPPIVSVAPASMDQSVLRGDTQVAPLTIFNTGGSDLRYMIEVRPTGGFPGQIERLASSPAPLTAVVEDPNAGVVYGQTQQGNSFYRYHASTNSWELLASPPLSWGPFGGAALLNNRIYTSSINSNLIGVYDIASNTWTTMHNPLAFSPNISSDGSRYLYLLSGRSFLRLDPATGATVFLAAPPFTYQRGGLRHHQGLFYAHEGGGFTGFAVYTVATARWTTLPPVPAGAVMGAAIDPFEGVYYTYGPSGGSSIYRYSIVGGFWTTVTNPHFTVHDGGLGWLPAPSPGVYLIQGVFGNGLARLNTGSGFIQPGLAVGTVAAGSSASIDFQFVSGTLPSGTYGADILLSSNDPATPVMTISADMTVFELPRMSVVVGPVVTESSRAFHVAGDRTSHLLALSGVPVAHATLELLADGNYQAAGAAAVVSSGGMTIGAAGSTGLLCGGSSGSFHLPLETLVALGQDGAMSLEVRNTPEVGAFCGTNSHTVRLIYPVAGDRVAFVPTPVGASRVFPIRIDNTGSVPLDVFSIASSSPRFVPSTSAVTVAPRSSVTVTVSFRPDAVGAFSGSLELQGNDPESPNVSLPLTGTAVEPPVLGVSPASLESVLAQGAGETKNLVLSNTGDAPLHFALNTSATAFLSIEPVTGTIAPGASAGIDVAIDTSRIAVGLYNVGIVVTTDDPAGAERNVPVALRVVGVPDLRLISSNDTVLTSTAFFAATQGTTSHPLALPVPPGGLAFLDVIAQGDFQYFGHTATAIIEGVTIGSVGGTQATVGCTIASSRFLISSSRFSTFAQDGRVDVTVQNAAGVASSCPSSTHTVTLTYGEHVGLVDVGDAMLGSTATGTFRILNAGSEVLDISSIASDSALFTVSPATALIPPGASLPAAITFTPAAEGLAEATMSFQSNDPARPVISLPVRGRGARPPVVGVTPASIESVLRPPEQRTELLTVTNTGQFPLSFSIAVPEGVFFSVSPTSGVVPAMESASVAITFEGSGLTPGRHTSSLDVTSNDPLTPHLSVPVSLYALGWPAMALEGPPVTIVRSRTWTTAGALSTLRLGLVPDPSWGGELTVTVEGEFGGLDETASVGVEDMASLVLGGAGEGGAGCVAISESLSLSPGELAMLAQDGVLTVTLQNSPQVGTSCPVNRHGASLAYPPLVEGVDFLPAFVGGSVTQDVFVRNTGTDELIVSRIWLDAPEFSALPDSLTLPPESSAMVRLRFAPSFEADFYATLHLESNVPGQPITAIPVAGTGIPAPVLGIQPPALSSTLLPGAAEDLTLTVSNSGGSDLIFSTSTSAAGAPFFSVSPFAGSLAPGESIDLTVHIDTAGLPAGMHEGVIEVASNDPLAGIATVPVSLRVIGIPRIRLAGDELSVESSVSYGAEGLTLHHLVLPAPAAGGATLMLAAEGEWGDDQASAEIEAEGTALGSVHGTSGAPSCTTASGIFPIAAAPFASLAANGSVDVSVQNSDQVGAGCEVNSHTVTLSYRRRADVVDFGDVYPGHPVVRSLWIENHGNDDLHVDSIVADRAEIGVQPASLTVAPGQTAVVSITMTPMALGPVAGSVSVHSDDPDTPVAITAVTATVVMPPVAGLAPASLTAALPPAGTTTRSLRISNSGASDLVWRLGAPGVAGPAPLPAWISAAPSTGTLAAGGFTDVTLTLDAATLADGDHEQTISLYSNDPVSGRLDVVQRLHVGEVAPEFFLMEPASVNLASNGNTVRASIQLPAPLDPHDVVLSSVRLNGTLSPIATGTSFEDENFDGRLELILKFDRTAFQAMLPPGQSTVVSVTGEVLDQTWFRGTAVVRMIRPALDAPNGGEFLLAGEPFTVSWQPPAAPGAVLYTVILSRDGGETWEYIARDLAATSFVWVASGPGTSRARVRVLAHDAAGVMGYDTSDADFTVAGALSPPHGVQTLEVRAVGGGGVVLSWTRPPVDADHGPADRYRVLRATSPSGPFAEIGSPAAEGFTDPAPPASGIVYYVVTAVNAAGESTD